jgi:hypothetical protein
MNEETTYSQQGGVFKRSEKFEINDIEFRQIEIDENRIIAKGKSWTTFELLISFIGAAWMEKWRRFGAMMLAAGVILLLFPLILPLFGGYYMMQYFTFFLVTFMPIGIVLIVIWFLLKREALLVFTPGGNFKIEGSSRFVDDVWSTVSKMQRLRDV